MFRIIVNLILVISVNLHYCTGNSIDFVQTSEAVLNNKSLQDNFLDVFKLPQAQPYGQLKVLPEEISRTLVSIVQVCSEDDLFRDMDPVHRRALVDLKNILRAQQNSSEFLDMAKILRDYPRMNYMLWLKGILSVSLERKDFMAMRKPNLIQLIPKSFLDSDSLRKAIDQAKFPLKQQTCIPVDGSLTTDNGIEQVLWYFREDLLINLQHMFWHVTYSTDLETYPNSTMRVDRKGELFYYFHHNMLARYNTERLVNGLNRTEAFKLQEGTSVEEGYIHHLAEMSAVRTWGNRFPNTVLSNITYWTNLADTIYNDIAALYLISADGTSIPLNNTNGIDVLGDAVECSSLSVNTDRYDIRGVHGLGHNTIANLSENDAGIMDSTVLALRDPIFYRWHSFIEDLFQAHKSTLSPYTPVDGELPLLWSGVEILDFKVQTEGSNTSNLLETSFGTLNVTLPISVDAQLPSEGFVQYCINRLQHTSFQYQITIERSPFVMTSKSTVRIFMAPRFNETGDRFTMDEQRKWFFALDEFKVDLNVGTNVITRQSIESSLSLQWRFEDPSSIPPSLETPHCGCGWPHNLLIPKGNTSGIVYDLFVMITDGTLDTPEGAEVEQEPVCLSSHIMCGKIGQKYPDARPMGYPFDRKPFNIATSNGERMVATLEEYTESITNMKAVQVSIFHTE